MADPDAVLNVAEFILAGAGAAEERVALRYRLEDEDDAEDVTFGELRRETRRFAALLREAGVAEEQRVLLVLPDSPALVVAFLGSIWAGAVPLVVNNFLRPDDYAHFIEDPRARLVVTTEALGQILAAVAAKLPSKPHVLTAGPRRSGSFWKSPAGSDDVDPFPTHPDDVAFWLYSSGTTGRPKGVMHRHRGAVHSLNSYGRHVLGTTPDDVVYATSKMFFAYGLGASLYLPLSAGASVVLSPERSTPERAWQLLGQEAPTMFFAVPTVYRALLDSAPPDGRERLAKVRRSISAGEGLPGSLFKEWRATFGIEILDGIGSTEALHIYCSNLPGRVRPNSVGWPVPGYELEVVSDNGQKVGAGVPGTVHVKGDSLAAGYWHRADATRRVFLGEWFFSGDQGVLDEDGSLRILGRTDDMLKSSGVWVAPAEVERVVTAVPGVTECVAVGLPAETGLTEITACVVATTEDTDELARTILERCEADLPRHARPRRVVFVDALPRTATGKVQRTVLRDRLRDREA